MVLQWIEMFVASGESRQRPVTHAFRVAPMVTGLLPFIAVLCGCSPREIDRDHIADPVRLVQSSGTPAIEVIPTPLPDGTPVPKPADSPRVPAETPKPSMSPDTKMVPGPEVVPAPPGIPEVIPSKDPSANPKVPGGTPVPAGQPGLATPSLTAPEDYRTWPVPAVALIVTGQQHGYIEPCGCTGLDRQKGGVARRFTFMKQLRSQGWQLVPIDAGNQVRRFGRQSEIKFQQTAEALAEMDYRMVGFGPDDVRLGVGELLAVVASDSPETALYASSNVVILDESLMPQQKIVTVGEFRIGMTSILDPEAMDAPPAEEILISNPIEAARKSIAAMAKDSANFRILTFFGKEEAAQQLAREVPGFDIVVVAGGYGEPTYKPQSIEGSKTRMIVTGNKGMYAGIVGLYPDQPLKYARVPLTHEFPDAPEMRGLMQSYQDQLKAVGLDGLGLKPIPHPSAEKFVGTATCAECHKSAFDVWKYTDHAEATAHIVEPPKERGDIARHFDPECISCHVTGWNAQDYYPYETGYLSLAESDHLTGNGCENCHGPGASHSAAERDGSGASEERLKELRQAMQLPLERAKERCMDCHDLDNSPDFHVGDAFEDDYWPQVEHYGVD